jgi:hypothetical protein
MFCLFPPGLVHRPNVDIGAEVIEPLGPNPANALEIALMRWRPFLHIRTRFEGYSVSLGESTKVSIYIRHLDGALVAIL